MTRESETISRGGLTATFLSGLLAILPIVITVAIVSWVAQQIYATVGPGTTIGETLRSLGLRLVTVEWAASIVGWAVVLVGVWFIGLLVKTRIRHGLNRLTNAIVGRIPLVKGIYGTAVQVVGMMNRDEQSELKSMSVVFCHFGQEHGAGFLALLTATETFRFQNRDYRVVYMPTSPLPMSGGIIFVPAEYVKKVDMSAEQLMQIYFSLGVLAPQVVPASYQVS
jgi:uncharacterized membrane protein